jgi:uncharacterized protein YdeI (YjbR/CyaY-like superfamily)
MVKPPEPVFFETPAAFRAWLKKHHARETELWMGYWKKVSGKPGLTYKVALDEALCWGWIDGIVKSIDGHSYMQRWTPRKKDSHWSLVNVRRFGELEAEGRVAPPGRAAFERRTPERTGRASFESPPQEFTPEQERKLKANRKAWQFFESTPAGYKRTVKFWVTQAKQAETRERRLDRLIEYSAKGERLPQFTSAPSGGKR